MLYILKITLPDMVAIIYYKYIVICKEKMLYVKISKIKCKYQK